VVASEEQQEALRTLAVSRDRRGGGSGEGRIADVIGLDQPTHCGSVRRSQGYGAPVAQRFCARRGRGAQDEPCTGTGPCQSGSGAESCDAIAGSARCDRHNWTLARLIGEIEAREGVTISKSRLSKVLRKKSSAGADRDTP
jgi:hypothetical protein